jgi:hypothetical protein
MALPIGTARKRDGCFARRLMREVVNARKDRLMLPRELWPSNEASMFRCLTSTRSLATSTKNVAGKSSWGAQYQ